MSKPYKIESLSPHSQRVAADLNINGQLLKVHYVTKFFKNDHDELWLFGAGLGDQACIEQMGDSYLKTDFGVGFGKVVIALGNSWSAMHAWKGDYNIHWVWGFNNFWKQQITRDLSIKTHLYLVGNKRIKAAFDNLDYPTLLWPAATGDVFHPLGLQRRGLGFSGLPFKTDRQKSIVLGPVVDRPDFTMHSGIDESNFFPQLRDLNWWYNTKQIVFGMIHEERVQWGTCPCRVMETLASGTPLIISYNWAISDSLGFEYPYLTHSAEQTVALVEEILADYPRVHQQVLEYSKRVYAQHHYKARLKALFKALETL